MEYNSCEKEFKNIVNNIMENKDFMEIVNCKHHGITRLEHSLRVSYYSYKVSKLLHLNVRETARAGLLHDFFINSDLMGKSSKERIFLHPKKALEKASNKFILSDMEKDIIYSHMFPLIPTRPPKYLEGWVVSIVDKLVAIYEFASSYSKICMFKSQYAAILFIILAKRGL